MPSVPVPGEFDNAVDRIRVVRRNGSPLGDITEASLDYVEWNEHGQATAEFTVSPIAPNVHLCKVRTRNSEVMIRTSTGEEFWGWFEGVTGNLQQLKFHCIGYMGYFGSRFIDRSSLHYSTPVNQQDIAADLIEYAQVTSGWGDDLAIVPRWIGTTNKTRVRSYDRWEKPSILDCLEELTQVKNGVKFSTSWEPDPDYYPYERFVRYVDIDNNHRGEAAAPDSFPLTYIQGRDNNNILDIGYNEDGGTITNSAYVQGGSAGDVRFEGNYLNTAGKSLRGLWQSVSSESATKDADWLQDRAEFETQQRADPNVDLELTTVFVDATLGLLMKPGDAWPIVIDYGRIQVDDLFVCTAKRYLRSGVYQLSIATIVLNSAPDEETIPVEGPE